jgi:hypothetical protein
MLKIINKVSFDGDYLAAEQGIDVSRDKRQS